MKTIKKVICIGSNCYAADITNSLNLRVSSPIDNISEFNIWKSYLLFTGKIYKVLFHEDYEIRPSSDHEKNYYRFWDTVFTFNHNFKIVHSNFLDKKYQKAIKRRIKLFKKFYKVSIYDESLWYIYSLESNDSFIDEKFMNQIYESLPEVCRSRLICLGIRGKNPLFKKFFKYYLEFEENTFKWNDRKQAQLIFDKFTEKFNLQFDY